MKEITKDSIIGVLALLLLIALAALVTMPFRSYINAEPTRGVIDDVLEDVNNDGVINCKDMSLTFYEMARQYGMNPRIIYGETQDGEESHLWIRINGVDIEPFAYKTVYFKPDKYRYKLMDLTMYHNEMYRSDFDWTHLRSYANVRYLDD